MLKYLLEMISSTLHYDNHTTTGIFDMFLVMAISLNKFEIIQYLIDEAYKNKLGSLWEDVTYYAIDEAKYVIFKKSINTMRMEGEGVDFYDLLERAIRVQNLNTLNVILDEGIEDIKEFDSNMIFGLLSLIADNKSERILERMLDFFNPDIDMLDKLLVYYGNLAVPWVIGNTIIAERILELTRQDNTDEEINSNQDININDNSLSDEDSREVLLE